MREWKLWDWIGFSTLWIAALALAADGAIRNSQELARTMPAFMSGPFWSFVPLVFLGIATIALLVKSMTARSTSPMPSSLSLFAHGGGRVPDEISRSNVWRWYWLVTSLHGLDKDGKKAHEHLMVTLVISFDQAALTGTMRVQTPDIALPLYEVKELNQRFAVIVFMGDVPRGHLHIHTT